MTIREKQILARATEMQKENGGGGGGNHALFRDNEVTTILKSSKIYSNVWHLFPN